MITFHVERYIAGRAFRLGTCLSTDTKPTNDPTMMNGSKLVEMDTSTEYYYDAESHMWLAQNCGAGDNSGGDNEEDEGMVFDMIVQNVDEDLYYLSDASFETIVDTYKSGKRVVLHFPAIHTLGCVEFYADVVGYRPEDNSWDNPDMAEENIVISSTNSIQMNTLTDNPSIENGKLKVGIYITDVL